MTAPIPRPPGPWRARDTALHRPQRTLTDADRQLIRGTALLNLQGALIMGIIDPVPNASPMSEDEGAWVREHALPGHFQEIDRKYPFGFHRWAMCERGTCWNCLFRRCDLCVHRQRGGPHVDINTDWVHNQHGQAVATLITRPGGEPCVWWCRCPCATTGPAPARPARRRTQPEPTPAADPRTPATDPGQAALFEMELKNR